MARQGVALVQAIAGLSDPRLKVDGIVGKMTRAAVASMDPAVIEQANILLVKHGFQRVDQLVPTESTPKGDDFGAVVRAVSSEALKRGLNPVFYVAHVAFETSWGRSVPKLPNGRSSLNYAGLKYESVKSQVKDRTDSQTKEYINGLPMTVRDGFAVFASVDDFARTYFWYLFDSPSAYRYTGLELAATAREFGDILKKGGYATDPAYSAKIAAVSKSVESRYGNLVV